MLTWQIETFAQLDSTQQWLRDRAEGLPAGYCVLAARQTAGVGREGRSWDSRPGGLYASFLLKPGLLLPDLPWALHWALLEALEQASGLALTLKAPNDLLAQGHKLAGMLIDSRILGQRPLYYVCGFGVNLSQDAFPAGLNAVSLQALTGRSQEPLPLLERVLARFGTLYPLLGTNGFEPAILAALGGRAVEIGYNGQKVTSFEEYWHGRTAGA